MNVDRWSHIVSQGVGVTEATDVMASHKEYDGNGDDLLKELGEETFQIIERVMIKEMTEIREAVTPDHWSNKLIEETAKLTGGEIIKQMAESLQSMNR